MDKIEILNLLGWCSLIYTIVLFAWILFLSIARNWIYKLHSKWLAISEEKFDVIHYSLIGFFQDITDCILSGTLSSFESELI